METGHRSGAHSDRERRERHSELTTGWVSSAARTAESFLQPHRRHQPGSPRRGAQLPWAGAAQAPGSSQSLPQENGHEKTQKASQQSRCRFSPCIRDERGGGGGGGEESHSFPGSGAAPPAKPPSQPQGSAQDGGFPARISSPLRPPRLLSVVAAGGGARRRCDSTAF